MTANATAAKDRLAKLRIKTVIFWGQDASSSRAKAVTLT
jgi:hypothetical protein